MSRAKELEAELAVAREEEKQETLRKVMLADKSEKNIKAYKEASTQLIKVRSAFRRDREKAAGGES